MTNGRYVPLLLLLLVLPHRNSPGAPGVDGAATKLVQAFVNSAGLPEIVDYNDPASPVGPFYNWQLTQLPNSLRASASNSIISKAYRASHPNLVIQVKKKAMGIMVKDERDRCLD